MFFLVGIFLAIFLGLLLLIKKKKSRADKILTIWIFFLIITQLLRYFTWTRYFFKYPHWLGVELSLPILHAVLLYFYVREITGNPLKNFGSILVHFATTVLLFLLVIPFYRLSGDEKINVYQNQNTEFVWFETIALPLLVLSGIAYSVWSLILIKRHQQSIQNDFSNTDKKELQWLKFLVIGNATLYILSIFYDNHVIFAGIVILVLFIGFFGINQLDIFHTRLVHTSSMGSSMGSSQDAQSRIKKSRPISKRYAKSGLNDEMASEIYSKLIAFMDDNAIYKNESITLTEFANLLKVHPNHLSQVINEQEGKNFYHYINSLRIKEFIKLALLPENKKYTIISLAYDVGFSSKSTFNKHFKTSTGKTPTAFFNTKF